jgi:hypothetical protein
MEALQNIDPMTWMIIGAAVIISVVVLFNKAVKFALKLAVIVVMLIFAAYFLVQGGVIEIPEIGK